MLGFFFNDMFDLPIYSLSFVYILSSIEAYLYARFKNN